MELAIDRTNTTKERVKILFVITGLGTGGAEMMLYKLLSRINRDRFCPTVVSMIEGGVFVERFRALNIAVFDLGMQPGVINPLVLIGLTKLLNQIKPDLIQGWMYHANLIAQLANFFSANKVPVFWSIHHSVDSLRAEKLSLVATIKLTALLSSRVETVVFSAAKGQKQHLSLGYNPSNAIAISDNFDISKYQPVFESDFNLRKSLNLVEDTILIGSVARYHPMKDHTGLIEAAALITDDFPNVHFVLIGPNVDIHNPRLTGQIEKLGVGEQVHLLGERQDVPRLMTSFDIFTSSSAYGESFSNVLGEAMSCQIPCVTTDVGDSMMIVGDTGIVVPPKDPQALAAAWLRLIVLSKDERQNLGRKARKHIKTNFDLDGSNSFVKKYESLYEASLAH